MKKSKRKKSTKRRVSSYDETWDKIQNLTKAISVLEKNLEQTNKKLDKFTEKLIESGAWQETEQFANNRAKTERYIERSELNEQTLGANKLNRIRGRHREILAMLINDGFHTYRRIAERLGISESRARAYVAALKNDFGIPLKRVRDPEGYKVGIDVRFVERILAFR